MKENIEEAIDRLEYVNRAYDCNNYYSRYDLDCIEILLSDYKRVLKENEELKKLMAHKNWYTQKLEEDLFENASNYVIKKQKVKDKIEDLKMSGGSDGKDNTENTVRELVIDVLQELLEESEEK